MRRINWFAPFLIIFLAAFGLRVFRLDLQSLWYDEAFSVYLAHFDLATIAARTAADIQPPLYYFLLNFWIALAGDSEFAVRFLALIFGVLTIPLLDVIARRLFDRRAARLAAILATVSPLYVWYAQEARMYTLITFLALLSSYALLKGIEADARNRRNWQITFALANIAAVYTHYFAFVVIAFQTLWIGVSSFKVQGFKFNLKPETWKLSILSVMAILVAFLPWLPFVVARFGQDASYWRGELKLDEALRHIAINFTLGESVLEAQAQWITLGWLGILALGLIAFAIQSSTFKTQSSTRAITFVLLYGIIPLALLLFLFSRNPKFNARYLMIASPAFFLLLGAGLASLLALTRRASRFALYVLPCAFLFSTCLYADANAYFDPAFTKASFRQVARYVEQHSAPDEAIILTSGHLFPAFNYYYRGAAPTVRLPDEPTLNTERILGYAAANVLNATLTGKRGVWVVEWQNEVVDPNGYVPMALTTQGTEEKITGTNFYQVRLRHWTLNPNARFSSEPQPATKREANFQNALQLLGYDAPAPTPADTGASFNLYWQVLDTFKDDYQIALRVTDAAGNVWGKQDRRPAGYNYPAPRWKKGEDLFGVYTVPLLPGTPAGDYFVVITFYAKQNESGLDVLAPNGAPLGKSVKLGPLPVLPPTKPATLAALNLLRENTISQPLGAFTLLGYQLSRDQASAGETIPLTLFWRADQKPPRDYTFKIQFGDAPSEELPIANFQFPTSSWRAGEIVRGQYALAIPPTAKDGATTLRIVLSDGNALALAPFTIEKTDRMFVKPNVQFSQEANFNNALALVGYDLPTLNLKPNANLKLVLHWNAREKMDKPYTVFVHLLDAGGKVVAQKDAQPANGARPTTGWIANEYIADAYDLALPANIAPGKYQIEIGWYDAKDPGFARLQTLDARGAATGDHLILQTPITVE